MNKNQKITILDGAMGTQLQAKGLKPGELSEVWSITHPELVTEIHRSYIEAGSQILYANTFGANRLKLKDSGFKPEEIIKASIQNARNAAIGTGALVALDIGPLGQLLEPYGLLSFEEAYDCFKEMAVAGKEAGADLVVLETMTDLYEVKAGVLAVRENTDLPVYVTMSFEKSGRTFTGCSVDAMAAVLNGLSVDAMGFNCSLGPEELLPLAQKLCALTSRPVIVKANAGLPDPETGRYNIGPEEFGSLMPAFVSAGVSILGGCCGTSPDFIREILKNTRDLSPKKVPLLIRSCVTTPTRFVEIQDVRVIGERLNPTGKKKLKNALLLGDMEYVIREALQQEEAGAEILDVNTGVPGLSEKEIIPRVIKALQGATDLPLQIDSGDPEAIEKALRVYNGKAIVNSVNGSDEKLNSILPLVKKYGAAVVGLTLDQDGIPKTAEGRFLIAEKILKSALSYGIPKEDVYIDCLTLAVSAEPDQARETLKAMKRIKEELGLQLLLGVSNISFGLPERSVLTAHFLSQALEAGLTLPIINPKDQQVMDAVRVFRLLDQKDPGASAYIDAMQGRVMKAPLEKAAISPENGKVQGHGPSDGKPDSQNLESLDAPSQILSSVLKGSGPETLACVKALLSQGTSEMDIVNDQLIPALDEVGKRFEKGVFFLPQLLNASQAAGQAFDYLKDRMAQKGSGKALKGKILLATVQGDIHDIGKNIVHSVLENYGYEVMDLGRDVAPEKIVDTAIRDRIYLIGLSSLMTTTLPAMEKTIKALRASGHDCKVMVGGAVLTPDYAMKIGADYYAKDAKASADIAREVLG